MPLLTSCGELFDVDEAGETTSATMKMDRDTVFIMPGDSLRLTVTFSPPEVKDKGVMWLIDQPEMHAFASTHSWHSSPAPPT